MNMLLLLDRAAESIFDSPEAKELFKELENRGYRILRPVMSVGLAEMLDDYPQAGGVVIDWNTMGAELFAAAGDLNEKLPFCVLTDKESAGLIQPPAPGALTLFPVPLPYRSAPKTAARIDRAVRRYQNLLLPPFTRALFKFAEARKNTFCTTGHLLGSAYKHHAMGRAFFDFFGPNVFRADTSVSVPDMGSLLDHTGVHKDAEQLIASAYGADRSYIITNGTSTANKVVGMYCVSEGDTVLMDRNCHKSMAHLIMMCNVTPIYLRPTRNAYGMIGGIPASEFSAESIAAKLEERPGASWPTYAVISDSTYDGLLYDVNWIKANLPVKKIHFDSAWSPYTPFNPIYENKFGMCGGETPGKTIFETHSAHKMLASFAQASYVHVKGPFDADLLDETYMMHTTTSANYPIVASAEMGAAMMTGNQGRRLLQNSIDQAMKFRRTMARLNEEARDWFFQCWQPDDISEAKCWPISRGERWHGFIGADEDFNYVDPIRVTVLTPGMSPEGQLQEQGIPASVVSRYLNCHGVVTEKTGPYHMLFLFALGVDENRTTAVLRALQDFKKDYDNDVPVREALPDLFKLDPVFYMRMTLQQLTRGLHRLMRKRDLPRLMYHAYDELPDMAYTPYQAFQRTLRGKTHKVPLAELAGKVSADMILPYPPGVPLVMPGERITAQSQSVLDFLIMLTEIGDQFPGFETEIHGASLQKEGSRNRYYVKVLDEE
ncbi:MAG: lysine decarboxylase LdcC [Pyramidobacter sp.]|nr:lysine decarboxylase LdcC [Pyramidobacter sp.]